MKNILNKSLPLIFFYFTVMPMELQEERKADYETSFAGEQVHQDLFSAISLWSDDKSVNENTAREIFKKVAVQQYIPQWYRYPYSLTKIEFMKSFVKYCKKRFLDPTPRNREIFHQWSIVTNLSTTYLGQLEEEWVPEKKRKLIIVGGIFTILGYKLGVVAFFKGVAGTIIKGRTKVISEVLLKKFEKKFD